MAVTNDLHYCKGFQVRYLRITVGFILKKKKKKIQFTSSFTQQVRDYREYALTLLLGALKWSVSKHIITL